MGQQSTSLIGDSARIPLLLASGLGWNLVARAHPTDGTYANLSTVEVGTEGTAGTLANKCIDPNREKINTILQHNSNSYQF